MTCQNETDKNTDGEGEKTSPTVFYRIEVDSKTLVVSLIGETEKILTKDEYEIDYSSFNSSVSVEYAITVLYKEDKKAEYIVRR